MGKITKYLQSNFAAGEITNFMYARVDLKSFYKGLKRARNVINIPQGGVRRRFGLKYVDQLSVTSFDEVKLEKFNLSADSEYLVVFTPLALSIYLNDDLVFTGATPYDSEEIKEIRVAQELATMIISHPSYPPYSLVRGASDFLWTFSQVTFKALPVFDFVDNYEGFDFTLGNTTGNNVLVTSTGAAFTPENVGGTFEAIPGLAKIITYVDPNNIRINIVTEFSKTTFSGNELIITEPAFSASRGWPATVSFYQQRLVFATTSSLPNGVFFSSINNFFNFQTTFGQATDALTFLIAGTENTVEYIVNAVSLFLFSRGGIYATPPLTESAFTAQNARINKVTNNGIKTNVEPIFADNQMFFIDRSGTNLISLQYNIETSGYREVPKGFTAKGLILEPIDTAKLEYDTETQGTYLYICNKDGSLAVYQTIDDQNINSWSISNTDGEFGRVQDVGSEVYFVIKRRINNQDVFYIERKDFISFFDSSIVREYSEPTTLIEGLDNLEHENVYVKCDGASLGETFLVDEGRINLPEPCTFIEVGLRFIPEITLLPVNLQTQSGQSLYMQRSIKTVTIDMIDTVGIQLNGEDLKDYLIGSYVLGSPPSGFTGFVQIPLGTDLDARQEVTITQESPYNMIIIAVEQEIELGG